MTMKELMRMDYSELEEIKKYMILKGNMSATSGVAIVQEYGHKTVKVVKGRKVPIGTIGEVFWLGSYCHSPYGDPWGIYTTYRCGIKDEDGNVYWTSVDNIEVM